MVLGAGKRLWEGFDRDLDLEILRGPPLAVRRAHEVRGHALTVVAFQRIRVANVYVAVADRLPNSSSANSGTLRVPRFPVSTPAPSR